MNRAGLFLWILSVALFFFSCQTQRLVSVETYHPAAITFPPEIKTVMIVNNSVQQPDNVGHQVSNLSTIDSSLSVSADGLAALFCLSLGKAVAESPLFEDVRICEDTLRSDAFFYISRPFTPADVEALCEDYQVDALITLDRLFFKTGIFHIPRNMSYNINYISVEIIGELKALYPGNQTAYAIPFADTLEWRSDDFYTYSDTRFTVQDVKDAMRSLADYKGQIMHVHFVPNWSTDTRWYYTSFSSGWKRASAYAMLGKWKEAANEWQALFDRESKSKQKARLASNLALCHEMAGDFSKAIELAQTAHSLFVEFADEEDKHRQMQQTYLQLLHKRLEEDKTLSLQLRETGND